MPRLADLKKYVGNPALYAVQSVEGAYRPVMEPLTDAVLQDHLAKKHTVGTYSLDVDKTKHFIFDDDENDRALTMAIQRECKHRALRAGVEWSGGKGHHVWVLLENWTLASDVRRLAKDIAHAVGFNGEILPKQDRAAKLGSLIKLPYGLHQKSRMTSRMFTDEPQYVSGATFASALAALPAGDEQQDGSLPPPRPFVRLPCLDSLMRDPPHEGERHNALFMWACRLRGGTAELHDEQVAAVLATVCDPNDLRPGEFDGIVEDSAKVGPPKCADYLAPERLCPPDLCLETRASDWKTQRPGEVRNAGEGDLVALKVHRNPDNPQLVELSHPDLSISRASLRTD